MTPLSRIIDHCRAHPEFLRDRASFYFLRDWADRVRAEHGLGAAMGASAELYRAVAPSTLSRDGPMTGRHGAATIMGIGGDILRDDLENGEFDHWNTIHDDGPYANHPEWHTLNPWFHLWHAATADTSGVGAHWAQNAAVTQPRDLAYAQGLLKSFTETPNPGRDELARLILEFIEDEGRPPRLLDIGCGVGNWLAWCVQYAGVDPKGCYGVDQLAGRIAGAQALGETVGIPRDNFMVGNRAWPEGLRPDIVILAALTGCLQDAELHMLAARIAQDRPAFVFETHVIDSWNAWIGRANSDGFFTKVGYRPLRSKFTGDVLTREGLSGLVLPMKYWPAGRVAIYERVA